jgi:serine/threonine protein kinase
MLYFYADDFCERLGQGACGVVWEGKDAEGKKVAIKVMEKMHAWELNFFDIIKELGPSIVEVIEKFETGDKVFLVMEYCERGSLSDFINLVKRKRNIISEEVFTLIV